MTRYSKAIICMALLMLFSCRKETVSVETQETDTDIQQFGPEMVLGEKLNNPYSLSNMQAAYESLVRTKSGSSAAVQLEPNCLYVRFLPEDSADIAVLQNLSLELFEYPLDYEIKVEGDTYHDPAIADDRITWQYTTVKPDFEFPEMEYEILEECYIPDESEDTKSGFNAAELETAAIMNADLPQRYQTDAETKALIFGKKPSGTLKVRNDSQGIDVGIKGAKVRCNYFVNISTTNTNENGEYSISSRYLCKPRYEIIYENVDSFVIWGNGSFFSAAKHDLGQQANSGYSTTVKTSDEAWKLAVINNAAYDFYNMCISEGLNTPPADLRIWCWPEAESSSASMLHHLKGLIEIKEKIDSAFKAKPLSEALLIKPFVDMISKALPDITIGMSYYGTPNSGYDGHYYGVWHELFHAIHFVKAREDLWTPYIGYIISQGFDYGDGTSINTYGKNICELGESWAYANEYFSAGKDKDKSKWYFWPSVKSVKTILDNGYLTRKQMYDCLTKDVKSIDDFKNKLIETYPDKKDKINSAF